MEMDYFFFLSRITLKLKEEEMENGLKEQITSKLEIETDGNNPVIVATATLTDNGGLIRQAPELQNDPDSVSVFTANYSALRKACDLQN